MNLIYRCRVFRPNTKEETFFSVAQEVFSKIAHILTHKANLNIYKKIYVTLCILFDHHRLKLDINKTIEMRKFINSWKLNGN